MQHGKESACLILHLLLSLRSSAAPLPNRSNCTSYNFLSDMHQTSSRLLQIPQSRSCCSRRIPNPHFRRRYGETGPIFVPISISIPLPVPFSVMMTISIPIAIPFSVAQRFQGIASADWGGLCWHNFSFGSSWPRSKQLSCSRGV